MNKFLKGMLALGLSATALVGCSSGGDDAQSDEGTASGAITVVSREDGSGTRGAFTELMGIEEDGTDNTTSSAQITNSTSVMMTTVEGNPYAIGYISLGSLNDTVKAVKIDGAEASVDTVKDGSYKIVRPFNIVTKDKLSKQAQDFENYIMSADGQKIIQDNGYIKADEKAPAYKSNGAKGKVVVGGSSSVTPVMEKLKEAYTAVNSGAEIEIQESDSTTGMTDAAAGTSDIGMASRELKDSETEQSYLLMHRHINGYGRLFGGQLVAWIDELAGLVGRRHCGHEITTACIDNLNFKHPAFLNDTVVLVGRVTYVGRTSMEVRVDTYVEELATGIRKMINRAYVVMVAIDENGRALPVPGLILESPEQEAEWEGGKRRYELRKERHREGF